MPQNFDKHDLICKNWLQKRLHSRTASSTSTSTTSSLDEPEDLIILDCRSSGEYHESHIRSALHFFIPSIVLRRLAAGKISLTSTIKSPALRSRIQKGYRSDNRSRNLFVIYNGNGIDNNNSSDDDVGSDGGAVGGVGVAVGVECGAAASACSSSNSSTANADLNLMNVLNRRLRQDGCRVVTLQDGFPAFRAAFPEWCESENGSGGAGGGGIAFGVNCAGADAVGYNRHKESIEALRIAPPTEQLMGLSTLHISTPTFGVAPARCYSSISDGSSNESSSEGGVECRLAGVGGGGVGGGRNRVRGCHYNSNEAPVEIIPGLFLGNASHSSDSNGLQKYNIKYILNVTPDLPNVFENIGNIQYLQIPITDHYSQDLAMHFPAAINFIEKARADNSSVLVHCVAGVSRSVTITLAYLMHIRSLTLDDAFNLVRERKPDVSPNLHFMAQLTNFETELRLNMTPKNVVETAASSRQTNAAETTALIMSRLEKTASNVTQMAKATGISPDSGIEFDRWPPGSATPELK